LSEKYLLFQSFSIIFVADGRTQLQRAEDYGVSYGIVISIDSGNAWKHIPNKDGTPTVPKNDYSGKLKERIKNNKAKLFTDEEKVDILKRLREKSIETPNETLKTPCWIYKGFKSAQGYGTISYKSVQYRIHVLSYEAQNQRRDLSGENKNICHKCNIKLCCNPDHLYFGTHRQNTIDALNNGSKASKLNVEQVKEIKKMLLENIEPKEICSKFNISLSNVKNIKNEITWSHVKI
jgi:hypothetical protein